MEGSIQANAERIIPHSPQDQRERHPAAGRRRPDRGQGAPAGGTRLGSGLVLLGVLLVLQRRERRVSVWRVWLVPVLLAILTGVSILRHRPASPWARA
jgi:hypothetical protein